MPEIEYLSMSSSKDYSFPQGLQVLHFANEVPGFAGAGYQLELWEACGWAHIDRGLGHVEAHDSPSFFGSRSG
jgi:hypothetical protein